MNASPAFAWLDGTVLPFEEARLPLSDRGLLLGDALFETMAVIDGRPFALESHLERMAHGLDFAGFRGSPSHADLVGAVAAVIGAEVTAGSSRHGVLRITVTRGPGRRGYSPRDAGPAHAFVVFHPGPLPCEPHPGWRLRTSSFRVLHGDPLASFKHGSRMLHVLARAEAEASDADEALLLNDLGRPAECASGNLLWMEDGRLCHADPDSGALAGVTQAIVLGLADGLGIPHGPSASGLPLADRLATGGAMVVLSTLGVVPVASIDGRPCHQAGATRLLAEALRARMLGATAT